MRARIILVPLGSEGVDLQLYSAIYRRTGAESKLAGVIIGKQRSCDGQLEKNHVNLKKKSGDVN